MRLPRTYIVASIQDDREDPAEVCANVVRILEAHREPDEAIRDPDGGALFRRQPIDLYHG